MSMSTLARLCFEFHTQPSDEIRVAQMRAAVETYECANAYVSEESKPALRAHGLAGIVALNEEVSLRSARLRTQDPRWAHWGHVPVWAVDGGCVTCRLDAQAEAVRVSWQELAADAS